MYHSKMQDNTNTSSKRLLKELVDIDKNPPPLCSAGLRENDLYKWRATIIGPPDSVYENGVFTLHVNFRHTYPFSPPEVSLL